MVVQHNLTAMNSNRMLGITTGTQAKSTEKLSSGYKINRAADDAAGLSISEKMRKQIRGLTQASSNAQDGISAVQTAEGALNEVQDMLQRMNELAVKAANGTNSEDDRSYIQNEIDQLTTEIDRVAETTKFNEAYLLKGDKTAATKYTYKYAEDAATAAATVVFAADATTGATPAMAFGTPTTAAEKKSQNDFADFLKKTGVTVTGTDSTGAAGTTADTTTITISNSRWSIATDGTVTDTTNNVVVGKLTATAGKVGTSVITASTTGGSAATLKGDSAKYYDKDGNGIPENALDSYFTSSGTTADGDLATTVRTDAKKLYDAVGNVVTPDPKAVVAKDDLVGDLTLTLHVGADATSNNQISLSLKAMSAKGLGVNGLKVDGTDDTNALSAIETIKEAIQKVSTQRSALGAVQNRLEHTINNLDNVVENTTSAESQIRDTDMATEMVKYSNNNILAQAGQAMLAQSNQANQGVLSLLQ